MSSVSGNSSAIARDINRFLESAGGGAIQGLERLDPAALNRVRDQIKGALDQLTRSAASGNALGMIAGAAQLKAIRDLAQFTSAHLDDKVSADALHKGKLGAGEQAALQASVAGRQAIVDGQLSDVNRRIGDTQQQVNALRAQQPLGPAGQAMLQAKEAELQALQGQKTHLTTVKASLEAEQEALRDGKISKKEAKGLKALKQINDAQQGVVDGLQRNANVMGQLAGGAAIQQFNQVLGALGLPQALSPQSFNPLQGNCCGDAGQPAGSLSSPMRIGDDALRGSDEELKALKEAGSGGGCFEDRVFALMCKVVKDMQDQIEKRLQKLEQDAKKAESQGGGGGGGGMLGGGGGGGGGGQNGQESRNIEFEKIKFDMQKLSQMQQAMSNVLNTMDELAKSAIRHIKAG